MQEQISDLSAQPSISTTPSVKLWTPGFIAGVTFFMGFPVGIVLSAINWMKMKMNDKAIIHLVVGAVGTLVFVAALIILPGTVGRLFGLIVNLGILFYLQRQMDNDQKMFQVTNRVEKAGWPGGCLIGLGVVILYFIYAFFISFVLVMLGVPIPD